MGRAEEYSASGLLAAGQELRGPHGSFHGASRKAVPGQHLPGDAGALRRQWRYRATTAVCGLQRYLCQRIRGEAPGWGPLARSRHERWTAEADHASNWALKTAAVAVHIPWPTL